MVLSVVARVAGYDFDEGKIAFWKMSLGNSTLPEEERIYEYCIENNKVLLGYGLGLDFSGCDTRQAVLQRIDKDQSQAERKRSHVSMVNAFKNEMRDGDLVIVPDGKRNFRAIGRITGPYVFDPSFDFEQGRPVEWLTVLDPSEPQERVLKEVTFSQRTLYRLSPSRLRLDAVRTLISEEQPADPKNYVIVIDEINRGNISKILGELVTLIEPDKRLGADNEIVVTLPYSKESFGVPPNLYLIGTMNTADKSIALVDVALRRRFDFEEFMPDMGSACCKALPLNIRQVMETLNARITLRKDRDHQIGHSYLKDVSSQNSFNEEFRRKIIPLLQEYFYNDWDGLRFVFAEEKKDDGRFIRKIGGSDSKWVRNKWQWFADAGNTAFDCLGQLMKNYGMVSEAAGNET